MITRAPIPPSGPGGRIGTRTGITAANPLDFTGAGLGAGTVAGVERRPKGELQFLRALAWIGC